MRRGPPRGVTRIDTDRVHIDARDFAGGGTGVSTYAQTLAVAVRLSGRVPGLLRAEGRIRRVTRAVRAALPLPAGLRAEGGDLIGHDVFRLAHVRFGTTGRVLRLRAPGPPGIMHWTYPAPIMIAGWANLYTVHDLIPILRPDLTSIDPARHARLLDALIPVARRIVTVSDAARADILAHLPLSPDRVVNCGQAVLPAASEGPLPAGVRADEYFLFCGRIEPRKNLVRLIEAHAASGTKLPLLLVGPVAEGASSILEAIARHPGVTYLDYVERPVLSTLIANAKALLFPSLAEGFGLPVAEAMAAGTATLVSRDTALLEIADGAAITVDAMDVGDIANAIRTLDHDDNARADLVHRGRLKVERYSPAAFATRLDALYRNLADDQ